MNRRRKRRSSSSNSYTTRHGSTGTAITATRACDRRIPLLLPAALRRMSTSDPQSMMTAAATRNPDHSVGRRVTRSGMV